MDTITKLTPARIVYIKLFLKRSKDNDVLILCKDVLKKGEYNYIEGLVLNATRHWYNHFWVKKKTEGWSKSQSDINLRKDGYTKEYTSLIWENRWKSLLNY
jgi:hypothetical protein